MVERKASRHLPTDASVPSVAPALSFPAGCRTAGRTATRGPRQRLAADGGEP